MLSRSRPSDLLTFSGRCRFNLPLSALVYLTGTYFNADVESFPWFQGLGHQGFVSRKGNPPKQNEPSQPSHIPISSNPSLLRSSIDRIMDGIHARARQTGKRAGLQGTKTHDSGWLVDLTTQNARAPCTGLGEHNKPMNSARYVAPHL